jgi:hypothetical protein
MKGEGESPLSTVAPPCTPSAETEPDCDPACFTLRQDESSPSVTEKRAVRTDPRGPVGACARSQVAPEVELTSSPREAPPTTSDDALRLAIKLAVDAGEYHRASELLDVAKRTPKPASITPIDSARGRVR